MKQTILIIEDQITILRTLMDNLKEEDFQVLGEWLGKAGLKTALSKNIDLIILDLMLPDANGLDICKEIKRHKITIPIIMLTAKNKEADKVLGLELGADDYITKPFNVNELLARIKAVLRRVKIHQQAKQEKVNVYKFGDIKLDFIKLEAYRGRKKIKFSKREFDVLAYMIKRKNEVVSRNDLLDVIWGEDAFPTTRTVDNFMWRIRKRIEKKPTKPKYLISIRAKGYKFVSK